MNQSLKTILDKVDTWFRERNKREQIIVVVGSLGLLGLLAYAFIFTPIFELMSENKQTTESAYRELQALPHALARYDRVRTRRAEIEKLYKSIEMPEGAFSYLESLIKEKAGIPPTGFTIKEGIPRKFGNTYEQVPYNIQYKITDYERLIKFLQELIEGQRPFIVNRVSLTKARLGESLDIDLEVSSVRKAQ